MTRTDTYIVRVYRRGPGRDAMRGVVEVVGVSGEGSFASAAELWQCLLVSAADKPKPKLDPSKGDSS